MCIFVSLFMWHARPYFYRRVSGDNYMIFVNSLFDASSSTEKKTEIICVASGESCVK